MEEEKNEERVTMSRAKSTIDYLIYDFSFIHLVNRSLEIHVYIHLHTYTYICIQLTIFFSSSSSFSSINPLCCGNWNAVKNKIEQSRKKKMKIKKNFQSLFFFHFYSLFNIDSDVFSIFLFVWWLVLKKKEKNNKRIQFWAWNNFSCYIPQSEKWKRKNNLYSIICQGLFTFFVLDVFFFLLSVYRKKNYINFHILGSLWWISGRKRRKKKAWQNVIKKKGMSEKIDREWERKRKYSCTDKLMKIHASSHAPIVWLSVGLS